MDRPVQAVSASDRLADRVWQVTLGIVFLVCAVCISAYATEWSRRIAIQHLVEDAQALRVGLTTEDEVRKLSQRYGGRFLQPGGSGATDQQLASYVLHLSSPYLTVGGIPRTLPGRRLWDVTLFLTVQNASLRDAYLRFVVARSDGVALLPHTSLSAQNPPLAPAGVSYLVSEPHLTGTPGEALAVELSPAATVEERRKAFDFNLSCLTALRECRHVCEIMPSAWRDLPLEKRIRYEDGREKRVDEQCRQRIR